MTTLLESSKYGSALTGLPERAVFSWWAAENGYTWPETNNPGNISYIDYEGDGHDNLPTGGVFEGVSYVNPQNKVCSYDTALHGIEAWAELLKAPTKEHGGDKLLSVDLADLLSCDANIHCMASKIGASNWASSHYVGEGAWAYPGGTIVGAYESTTTVAMFSEQSAQPAVAPHSAPVSQPVGAETYTVVEGDTLNHIALRFKAPVSVLARLNNISVPNHIEVGQVLHLPRAYELKSGDTLTALSERFGESVEALAYINGVNPDRIYAGTTLYY